MLGRYGLELAFETIFGHGYGFASVCLIFQGHLPLAIDFVRRHNDCFFDIVLLSTVATASQFFISYTIRTFGALTFATIMTTRQLVSIMLSCVWFSHPLSWQQWIGASKALSVSYVIPTEGFGLPWVVFWVMRPGLLVCGNHQTMAQE
ncbi:UDP-galactose/UDP-glucose transporter 5 [Vitis vinifera]|uniref:UDP-galactose/UDP-glucose transporter 5 n=1 Tax=Vitis vinifera TaxID=29760 RepID=A0A438FAT6_VITVI|nr:UDP-galactose/UDP-glucose transporter 5 [Vitis vinifera]